MTIHGRKTPSYWMGGRLKQRHPRAQGRLVLDVAVTGAGLTGLSATFHLKRANPLLRIGVFESNLVGFGASGRSAGILIQHPSVFGSVADVAYLRRFVSEFEVECDWRTSAGCLVGLGCEDEHDLVDPMMLCVELDRLCHQAGIEVFEESEVRTFDETCRGIRGKGFSGIADQIVFATDAYRCPWRAIRQRLITTAQPCIVVEVANRARKRIPWTFLKEEPDGTGYFWGRRIGVRHFLLGGIEVPCVSAKVDGHAASSRLLTSFTTLLPEISGATLVSGWTGYVARFSTGDRRIVRSNKGAAFIGGYGGYGVAASIRSRAAFVALVDSTEREQDFRVTMIGSARASR